MIAVDPAYPEPSTALLATSSASACEPLPLGTATLAMSPASACEPQPAQLPSMLAMCSAFEPLASGASLPLPVREEVAHVPGACLLRGAFSEAEAARLCSAVRLVHSETLAGHSAHDRRRDSQHHCA